MSENAGGVPPREPAGPPPPPPMAARPPAVNPWAPVSYGPPRRRNGGVVGGAIALVILVATAGVMAVVPNELSGHAIAVPISVHRSDASPGDGARADPRAVPELETNPILANGVKLGAVSCELPQLGDTGPQLSAFYEALTGCLEQAWRPALDRADEPSVKVAVSVTLPKVSACGAAPSKDQAVAYYCGGDTTIYAPTDWMLSDAGLNRSRHLATIAHEYGHHVQSESGILTAAADRMSSPDQDSPADLALVRRIELQANCFGALFIAAAEGRGSISRATANAAVADYGRADDSDDHGSRAHQLSWAKAGFTAQNTAACNTWSAPADKVS
ncbi:neutral zinc metallopeptidase [Amycolatopsis sp. NPDC050768]|uniref:neutral zinc metallopeptidase n=1 Tax=Amycolatopsis sp. NPDC050768 TaxID=3154839 RepID=UPI003404EF19